MCAQRILRFTSASRLVVVGNKFGIIYSEQSSDENDGDTKQTDIEQKQFARTHINRISLQIQQIVPIVRHIYSFIFNKTNKKNSEVKKSNNYCFSFPCWEL